MRTMCVALITAYRFLISPWLGPACRFEPTCSEYACQAIDRDIIPLGAEIVDGVPTALNAQMAAGTLDVSVISAVEYARDSSRYLLLPDLAISCDGPVRSVVLFSKRPASELAGRRGRLR